MPSYSPAANYSCGQAESKGHFEYRDPGIIINHGKRPRGGRPRRTGLRAIEINALPELLPKNSRMEERNGKSFDD